MNQTNESLKVKVFTSRIPKWVVCPSCQTRQPFRKKQIRWRKIREMDIDQPTILKVRIIRARCLNQDCQRDSFTLPVKGIKPYARATERLKEEAVAGIINDNSTLPRISKRIRRCFNTAGSKSAIDRWKQNQAAQYSFKDIIAQLGFSGVICLDEYSPSKSDTYDLIASDGLKPRILYIDNVNRRDANNVLRYLEALKQLLCSNPWAIIFDIWDPFPGTVKRVFGKELLIQYDYFHIMKTVHWHLRNCLAEYRKGLKEWGHDDLHRILWNNKWIILKNPEDRTEEQKAKLKEILSIFKGTVIENMLTLKERVRDIFLHSSTSQEAKTKRDQLLLEGWQSKNEHFRLIINFISGSDFSYMTTFLDHPSVPR